MSDITNYLTLNYGAWMGFQWMYTFLVYVHDSSYISCSTNQTLGKPWWWTNYTTQTVNWYKIFSIKPTCFIFSSFVQKATAQVDKKALNMRHHLQCFGYLCWNFTTAKRVPHPNTYYTEDSLFTWSYIWQKNLVR